MIYFDVLINSEQSIRGLARQTGLAYETLRDRLNNSTPTGKQRNGVPLEKVHQAHLLMKGGLSVRQTARVLDISKSHIHNLVNKYRKSLDEEED